MFNIFDFEILTFSVGSPFYNLETSEKIYRKFVSGLVPLAIALMCVCALRPIARGLHSLHLPLPLYLFPSFYSLETVYLG